MLKSDRAKDRGRHAVALPERACKMGCTVGPTPLSDLFHCRIRGAQQVFRLPQPVLQQIFMRRTVNVSLKAANQVRFADAATVQQADPVEVPLQNGCGYTVWQAPEGCWPQLPILQAWPARSNTVDTGRDLMFIGEHAAGGADDCDEMLAERRNVWACMDIAEPLVQIIRVLYHIFSLCGVALELTVRRF